MIAELVTAASLILPTIPGALNPDVTPATVNTTICVPNWSSTVRPPLSYTAPIKRRLLREQNLPGRVSDYQLDHLWSISLGGATRSLDNLWMEPDAQAARADRLESRWHRLVCNGTWGLRYAQRVEARFKRDRG